MKAGLGEPLRRAILNSDESLNELGRRSRVDASTLSRFTREDRDLRLSKAWMVADALGLDLTLLKFLRHAATVHRELEAVVSQAEEVIRVIGTKSRYPPYLDAIEGAVINKHVSYDRLLAGKDISHSLHAHLRRLLPYDTVTIRTTKTPYFGQVTVTEKDCVLALPAPRKDELYGMRFLGQPHSRRFAEYFSTVFEAYQEDADQVVNEQTLLDLCEHGCPERSD